MKSKSASSYPLTMEALGLLLNKHAELGARDDVAMDLGQCDDPQAENILRMLVTDATEDEMIVDSAGESLWEIWQRKGVRDEELIARMLPSAKKFFVRSSQ